MNFFMTKTTTKTKAEIRDAKVEAVARLTLELMRVRSGGIPCGENPGKYLADALRLLDQSRSALEEQAQHDD